MANQKKVQLKRAGMGDTEDNSVSSLSPLSKTFAKMAREFDPVAKSQGEVMSDKKFKKIKDKESRNKSSSV